MLRSKLFKINIRLFYFICLFFNRFRHVLPEPELSTDIVPPFRDDIQLSVQEYRSKLYELISSVEKNNFISKSSATATNVLSKRRYIVFFIFTILIIYS